MSKESFAIGFSKVASMYGIDAVSLAKLAAAGNGTLGNPDVSGLPAYSREIASDVGARTKDLPALRWVNPDSTDIAILNGIVRSDDMMKLFAPKWSEMLRPWGPAKDTFDSVHPDFSNELFSWKNILKMKNVGAAIKRDGFDRNDIRDIMSWLEKNKPQRDLFYSAVTNRNDQLAKDSVVPTWADRRRRYELLKGLANSPGRSF